MTQYCGENGAFIIMTLNICTMLSAMLWGNGRLTAALSFINPMRLAPIMWTIRSVGHSAIDFMVAKSGSKSLLWPLSWVADKGQKGYQIWKIGTFIIPIIYSMLSGIISLGLGVAGSAYGMAGDMLAALPSLFLGSGEEVTA